MKKKINMSKKLGAVGIIWGISITKRVQWREGFTLLGVGRSTQPTIASHGAELSIQGVYCPCSGRFCSSSASLGQYVGFQLCPVSFLTGPELLWMATISYSSFLLCSAQILPPLA